jgi:PST family polysaccharide transporter
MIIEVTSSLIDSVAFPLYSKLQDDRERLTRLYYQTTSFVAVLAFPAFFLLLVLSPQVVEVFFGTKWARSAPVMQILTLIGIVQALNYLNSTMIKALGKPSWRVAIVSINAVLNVVAFAFAVTHGINAVAIALVIVGYVVLPVSYWAVHRLMPVDPVTYVRHVWGPLAASLALAGAAFAVRRALEDGSPLVTLIAAGAAGLLAYCVVLVLVARPLSREIRDLAGHALARDGRRGAGVESAGAQP